MTLQTSTAHTAGVLGLYEVREELAASENVVIQVVVINISEKLLLDAFNFALFLFRATNKNNEGKRGGRGDKIIQEWKLQS